MTSTSSSARLPSTDPSNHGSSQQRLEADPVLELNELSSQVVVPGSERDTWFSVALSKFSRQHRLFRRIALYMRGPRPTVDLPRG